MTDRHHRIAERAYFLWLAGIGSDDLDRWLTAETLDRDPAPAPRNLIINRDFAIDQRSYAKSASAKYAPSKWKGRAC